MVPPPERRTVWIVRRPSAWAAQHPTGWVVLTFALGAAVIALTILVIVLQQDKVDAGSASAAQVEELEQERAALEQQVADLEQELEDAEASGQGAAAAAQEALDAAREQFEGVSDELGATSQQ
ncbi:MAG: hypothetical protein ACRDM2_10215, partial [Gaiellaceae bacterium]